MSTAFCNKIKKVKQNKKAQSAYLSWGFRGGFGFLVFGTLILSASPADSVISVGVGGFDVR